MEIMSEERADYIAETLVDGENEDSPSVEFRDPIKELGFAKVDHILTLDTKLSDGAYRTYALLHYYWQRKHVAWAGTDTLALVRDVKESTIRKHLKELQDAGLITRQRRMGKSSMTYLEDLPERYAKAAAAILTKRQKSSGKSAINLAVRAPKNERLDDADSHEKTRDETAENTRGMRTIEGEPLKERGDSKNESPALPEKKELQPCGHPVTAIVGTDEGTRHCGECAAELQVKKDFDAMRSQSEGMAPAVHSASHKGADRKRRGVSSPWDAAKDSVRELACGIASVITRTGVDADTFASFPSAFRDDCVWKATNMQTDIDAGKVTRQSYVDALTFLQNGGGAKYEGKAVTPSWVARDVAEYVMIGTVGAHNVPRGQNLGVG